MANCSATSTATASTATARQLHTFPCRPCLCLLSTSFAFITSSALSISIYVNHFGSIGEKYRHSSLSVNSSSTLFPLPLFFIDIHSVANFEPLPHHLFRVVASLIYYPSSRKHDNALRISKYDNDTSAAPPNICLRLIVFPIIIVIFILTFSFSSLLLLSLFRWHKHAPIDEFVESESVSIAETKIVTSLFSGFIADRYSFVAAEYANSLHDDRSQAGALVLVPCATQRPTEY